MSAGRVGEGEEGGRGRERRPGSRCGPRAGPGPGRREPGRAEGLGGPLAAAAAVGPLPCRTCAPRRSPPALCPPRSSSRLPTPIRSGSESRGRGPAPTRRPPGSPFLSSLAFLSSCLTSPFFHVAGVLFFLLLFYALGVLFLSPSSWVYIIMLLFCRATGRPWRPKRRWNAFRSSLNIIK